MRVSIGRRLFLSSIALLGCRRRKEEDPPPAMEPAPSASAAPIAIDPRDELDILDWEMPNEYGGEKRCVVLVPKHLPPGTKLPLLIALHGMGETTSPQKGAYGWLESYELDRVIHRLRAPPLDMEAFRGLVTTARLTEINAELAKRPYGGLVVACPYLPRAIGGEVPYDLYGNWLADRLLPKLRAETPVLATTSATGIDGVSLGGITALRIGLSRADLFGAIGALQPAVNDDASADALAAMIADKIAGRPLRIVTSTEDSYRVALAALDEKLWAREISHQFFVSEGPHDYVWNQGPGGIEMVLWHDRVLRL
jgi:iron(III)-salmochelin esterase